MIFWDLIFLSDVPMLTNFYTNTSLAYTYTGYTYLRTLILYLYTYLYILLKVFYSRYIHKFRYNIGKSDLVKYYLRDCEMDIADESRGVK